MKKVLVISVALLFVMVSCNKDIEEGLKETSYTNLKYGDDPQQTYDIYLPAGRSREETKLLIFVHGGGWSAGDKNDFTLILNTLEDNGFAIANINYRLANSLTGVVHPMPAEDVRLAVDHLISISADYKFSDEDIILAGHSAGGHLSLFTALALNDDKAIKGVISLAGPTNLEDPHYQSLVELSLLLLNYTGFEIFANPAAYSAASPIQYVTPTSVPQLLLYAELDEVVPIQNGTDMRDTCMSRGAAYTYIGYPTYGHELGSDGLTLPEDVTNPIISFIQGL